MNKVLIATLLVLLVANTNAVFLKKPSKATFNVFNQLKEFENVSFGKNLLDTINLQITNKSPLGDIAKMLEEIRSDLTLQQKNDDQVHAERETECADEINEYNRRINTATIQRDDAESEITNIQSEISRLKADIANKKAQIDILNVREVDLREARELDAAEFENRQRTSVEVVGALELIIEKLQTISPESDSEAALAELARIGSSNPIMALVQVASTFSEEALNNVVTKLQDLRSSLEASIEDDKVNEEAAKGEYAVLLSEIESTRTKLQQGLGESESSLRQYEGALAI
jgi:predicted  nucleic acid-binding Zn-ribbon protein